MLPPTIFFFYQKLSLSSFHFFIEIQNTYSKEYEVHSFLILECLRIFVCLPLIMDVMLFSVGFCYLSLKSAGLFLINCCYLHFSLIVMRLVCKNLWSGSRVAVYCRDSLAPTTKNVTLL